MQRLWMSDLGSKSVGMERWNLVVPRLATRLSSASSAAVSRHCLIRAAATKMGHENNQRALDFHERTLDFHERTLDFHERTLDRVERTPASRAADADTGRSMISSARVI